MTDTYLTAMDVMRHLYRAARTSSKMHNPRFKLADGTELSCQDFRGAYAELGVSLECALFDADGERLEIPEWGESFDNVYGHRSYQLVANLINRRGGLAND
mgnify:CR=1 FL=1